MVSRQILYFGEVQGVGFRRRTLDISTGFVVTGFVRNLADGSVELAIDGEEKEVARFLSGLDKRLGPFIAMRKVQEREPTGCSEFTVRRD